MFRKFALVVLSLLPVVLAQISNDFESGWNQTTWPIYAPDCNQGGTVALDSMVAHSGTNSMKVTSPGGYCGHIFFGTTAIPSGNVFVRFWVKATKALTSNHISFLTMPDNTQSGKHLRFGGQDQILMYNRESDDATMPDMSPQGTAQSVPLPTGSWECIEFHLGTNGTIETWLNSNSIPGLTIYPGTANAAATQFQKSVYIPKITGVYFGWESYGSDANTFWYDDISIQSSRIGCNSTGSSTSPPSSSSASATSASSSVLSSSSTVVVAPPTPTCTVAKYGQCGGSGFTGCTVCASGSTCTVGNTYYSQCL